MLHIRMISGQEVASIPVAGLVASDCTVKALKQRLHVVHGLPSRFRQRLLFRGKPLDDSAKVDTPMDVEVVLLPYLTASEMQANQMLAATTTDGDTTEVEAMLQQPLHPEGPELLDNDRLSPLLRASARGYAAIVGLLLEAGANKNFLGAGLTALMYASRCGHIEVVRLLLEADADMNVGACRDFDGETALIMASISGHVKVVRLLLEAGVDKNSADNSSSTALIVASELGRDEVARLLLCA